jgi:hypothetical protein
MATPQELADKIKQIEANLSKLNAREQAYYQDALIKLKANTTELEEFEILFRDVVNAADELNSELSYISKSFRDSVAELSKQNKELSNAKGALSSISKIAREIVYENSQGVLIEDKTLDKLEKKAKLQFQSLQIAIQSGRLKGNELTESKSAADEQQRFFNAIQGIRGEQEKIKKNAGIRLFTGLEGISSAIPGLSKFTSAFQDASKASQETAIYNQKTFGAIKGMTDEQKKEAVAAYEKEQNELNFKFKKYKQLRSEGLNINEALQKAGVSAKQVKLGGKLEGPDLKSISPMMAGLKSLGPALVKALGPLALLKKLVDAFKFLKDALFEFSERTSQIARDLGVSKEEAYGLSVTFQSMADSTSNILVNQKNLTASSKELNSIYGTNVIFTQKTLEGQIDLVHRLGLQTQEAQKISQLGLLNNKTQNETISAITKQNNSLISNKKVIEEVAKASNLIFAQYKGSPELIARAVIQTQKLGLSLEQAQGISKNLLNFESSIASEMEAELLTGQQLNLEQARYLALMGDSAGAAAEVLKNLGPNGLSKFMGMNVIQQEALAGALGMSADQLADSLVTQQSLSRLSKEDRKGYEEAIKLARERGELETANALENLRNRGKSLDVANMELGAQQKFNLAVEKLKERFVTLFNKDGAGAKFLDKLTKVIETIANTPNLGNIMTFAGVLGAVLTGGALMRSLTKGTILNPMITRELGVGGGAGGGMLGNVGKAASAGRFLARAGGATAGLIGGSAIGGGGTGAMIGSAIGTGIGAFGQLIGIPMPIGMALGGMAGGYIGGMFDKDEEEAQIKTSPRDESIGSLRAMAEGGIVTKPTRALVGEAGAEAVIPLKDFNDKLDKLINAVMAGSNIYIDGALLQKGMTLAAVKTGS